MAIVPIPEKPVLPQPGPIKDVAVTQYISGLNRNLYDILAVTARRANASTWINPGDDQTAGKLVEFNGTANKVQASALDPALLADLIAMKPAIAAILGTGNGLVTKTGSGTYAARTIQGTSGQVTVSNGDGVAGNPTLSIPPVVSLLNDLGAGIGNSYVNFRRNTGNTGSDFVGISGTDGVYLASNTDVLLSAGTPSHVKLLNGRLMFPAIQNPSTNANTLDDYEEGTWTPTVTIDSGTGAFTYTNQAGFYIKIGREVFLSIDVRWSAKMSGAGSLLITGLPFAAGATAMSYAGHFVAGYSTEVAGALTGLVTSSQINLYANTNNILSGTVVNNAGTIIGAAKYATGA